MPRQSTRHKYRSRREKNDEAARITRIVATGAAVALLFLFLSDWGGWRTWILSYL